MSMYVGMGAGKSAERETLIVEVTQPDPAFSPIIVATLQASAYFLFAMCQIRRQRTVLCFQFPGPLIRFSYGIVQVSPPSDLNLLAGTVRYQLSII